MLKLIRLFILVISRFLGMGKPMFLIVAPSFTHRSSGIRALYRLCHHLNMSGYPSAIIPIPGDAIADYSPWYVFGYKGEIDKEIVIYPEVVSGNPYKAKKVIRWVLNNPGLLGGDTCYAEDEVVFVFDPNKIDIVNKAIKHPIGLERVLRIALLDPDIIYPDPNIEKVMDCCFSHKGHSLAARFPLDPSLNIKKIEDITPDPDSLGDVLRKTRTLYSYDHYSAILREAAICGCEVRTIDAHGVWHNPEHCDCALNVIWTPNFRETYKAEFYDNSFVPQFLSQLPKEWLSYRKGFLWHLLHFFMKRCFRV